MPKLTDSSIANVLHRLYAANALDHNAPYQRASGRAALTGIQDDCLFRIDPHLDSVNASELNIYPDIGLLGFPVIN